MQNRYYSVLVDGGGGVCREPVALAVAQNTQAAVVSDSCWSWAPRGQAWVCAWLCEGVLHKRTRALDFTPCQ